MKVRLGDVATYINGYAFKPEDWSDSGLPIIRIQDLTGNSYKTNRFSGKYDKKFEVNDGDILISWSASIGVYVWRGEKAVLNQHIFKVKFDKQVNICKKFFIYQVENILKKAILETHGATMKHLTKPVFDSLPFYLPDIKKQNEISAILDKISEIISLRQRQLKKLDELVKSRFIEMFGDPITNSYNLPIVPLGELSELITKGASPSWQGFSYTDDRTQTLFITSENVREGYIDLSFPKYIEDGFNDKQKRSVIHKGDFLINIVGASIGRAAQFNLDCKANMNQAAALVRINDKRIKDNYLLIYLNSEKAQRMYDLMKSDTGRANLSLKDISDLSILLPPIAQQEKFEKFFTLTNKSKLEIKKSLDKLEILKKSLMQEYFS